MTCVAASAKSWRNSVEGWSDDFVKSELRRAWVEGAQYFHSPLNRRNYHDWANFRAATLREARKRGLDISVTGLGT